MVKRGSVVFNKTCGEEEAILGVATGLGIWDERGQHGSASYHHPCLLTKRRPLCYPKRKLGMIIIHDGIPTSQMICLNHEGWLFGIRCGQTNVGSLVARWLAVSHYVDMNSQFALDLTDFSSLPSPNRRPVMIKMIKK